MLPVQPQVKPPRGFWKRNAYGNPTSPIPSLPPLTPESSGETTRITESSAAHEPRNSEIGTFAPTDERIVVDDPVLLVPAGLAVLYNREQLYEDAWSFPMCQLAEKYGVTDRALAKACRKLHVRFPLWAIGTKSRRTNPGTTSRCPLR